MRPYRSSCFPCNKRKSVARRFVFVTDGKDDYRNQLVHQWICQATEKDSADPCSRVLTCTFSELALILTDNLMHTAMHINFPFLYVEMRAWLTQVLGVPNIRMRVICFG